MAEPPPNPIPVAIAIVIKKKGKKKPTADKASAPSPETHIASTKLYIVCTDMATIIGKASLTIAFLGSSSRVLTPSVCISGEDVFGIFRVFFWKFLLNPDRQFWVDEKSAAFF
jgi:hypothetical protein